MRPSRRRLMTGSAALAGMGLLPRPVRAAPADRRFIFIVNFGGWDVTRAIYPAFDNPVVDMEPNATTARAGNLDFVDHPERPMVRDFFQQYHDRTMLLHGILVPSVAHMACLRLILTGRIAGRPDWPAILASAVGQRFALPHLVLSGPSYPADLGAWVTRTGTSGQLEALITGDIAGWSDTPVDETGLLLQQAEQRVLERRVRRAVEAAPDPRSAALLDAYAASLDRAEQLKLANDVIDWETGGDFVGDCLLAADMLAQDLASCVTVTFTHDWDTHALNDIWQNWHWQGLFDGLNGLMQTLDSTPGHSTPTLAEETVVVVLSEMGRTPGLNAEEGKDHWPYTSAMLIGPGFTGDRVVGGYDDTFYGRRLDHAAAEATDSGSDVTCDSLGATLLALADVDPGDFLPGASAIEGVLT
ncbi:MAG: DUF1501 domain-containing protein [Alphaproteobacteria bacterium]|nr:DUF1501 domain-containing protein [Alphaproteobacteria bacterium]